MVEVIGYCSDSSMCSVFCKMQDAGVLLRRERIQKSVKSMPSIIIAHCVLATGYVNLKFFLRKLLFGRV
jgi:hypothetical protein